MYSFCAMYSFRMSVWIVPRSLSRVTPWRLADADVEREQHRRRRIDRHRRRDLPERDAVEQQLHVLERVDRDALTPDLTQRPRVIRVETHQRRHVERRRQPRLAVLEQVAEAPVRLLGRAEARELPHRPQPAAVHRLVHAARERVRTGITQIAVVVDWRPLGPVDRLDLDAADRRRRLRRGHRHRIRGSVQKAGIPIIGVSLVYHSSTPATLGCMREEHLVEPASPTRSRRRGASGGHTGATSPLRR